ncbi:large terminase protein [uncultured Caudovirales phage]|uniref:Large terminase protein n=1 Tax=uncultured Caudovirales phage TaxID=2100421 RepID=A0A6J5L058_9CAUD|nr:large terminase protein [uncultured Caudovirales phage]
MASLTYNSNPQLKAANVPVQYTQEQVQEYIKCKNDPVYFIKNYVKIITLDCGLVPFVLFDYQVEFILTIHENRRSIGMFPRQHGKTTTVAAYLVWYSIFNNSTTVAILANKAAAAREVMSRYQMMYEELPVWLQHGIIEWNKGSIALENKSKVFISATTTSGIRGKSVNLLYIDELSSVSNTVAEEFFASTYPTISSGKSSKVIITSTPIGFNHFWRMWDGAEKEINGFIPKRVEYWEHPDHDEKWALEQKELLGEVKYNQEVLMHFLGSSYTLVPGDNLSKLSASQPVLSRDGVDIYEEPDKSKNYVMTVDVAKGVGGDYSIIQVMDITDIPYKQVAKYRNNTISPLLFPNIIHKIARDYNNAHILIEINISEQVAHILHYELEYENMLLVNKSQKGLNRGQVVGGGFGNKPQLGVQTDKKVKRIGCNNLKSLIVENKLLINDLDTIAELSTFIEVRDSYAADDGYHDDLVMGLVIFAWLTTQPYFKELNNVELRQVMYQNQMRMIEEELTPFGFYDDGQPEPEGPVMLLNF